MTYLWLGCLCFDAGDGVGVSAEGVDTGLSTDIPHPTAGVSRRGQQYVYRRVKVNRLTGRQVTVVMSYYLEINWNFI